MLTSEKRGIVHQIVRFLESSGGLVLSHVAFFGFCGYLGLAYFFPDSGLVKFLQEYGETAQVVSIAGVLAAALSIWWYEKMLFKIKEREEMKALIAAQSAQIAEQSAQIIEQSAQIDELKAGTATVPALEQQIAALGARVAQLENEKAQQPPQ